MIKNIFFPFAVLLLVHTCGYSQTEFSIQKPLKIDAVPIMNPKENISKNSALNIPSTNQELPSLNYKKPYPVQMLSNEELVQAGANLKIDPRITPSERLSGTGRFFPDQYLGDIKSESKFIGIVCRDHEFVDGDRVRILVNDIVVDHNVLLTADFKGVNVDLKKGFNKIDFEALNHGSSAPNTAQVHMYDDSGILIYATKWLLSTGSKATIIITKS